MKKLVLTAALGAACLGLAACGDGRDEANMAAENAALTEGETGNVADTGEPDASGADTAATGFPEGARIVEEGGVTYRIDPDGTRVELGENDSRIVVENGVRYRVDPNGSRVRIGPDGVAVDVDLPDVDVGVNEDGNLDVDVEDGDPPN